MKNEELGCAQHEDSSLGQDSSFFILRSSFVILNSSFLKIASANGCSDCRSKANRIGADCRASSLSQRMCCTAGCPSVTVPVLSSTTALTLRAVSRLSASLMRMPRSAPLPMPTMMAVAFAYAHHDGGGRGQSQGAGAGDDEHRHQCQQAVGEAFSRGKHYPEDEREQRNAHDGRHEDGGYPVHQLLYGSLGTLRVLHQVDNFSQERVCPHLLRAEAEAAFLVDGAGIDLVVRPFGYRSACSRPRKNFLRSPRRLRRCVRRASP